MHPPACPLRLQVGLAGQAPGLLGLLSADLAVGGVAGATAVLTFGTLTPHLAAALGRRGGRAVAAALLLASLGVAGWASVQFSQPYRWGSGSGWHAAFVCECMQLHWLACVCLWCAQIAVPSCISQLACALAASPALTLSVCVPAFLFRSREHPKRLMVQHIHKQGAGGPLAGSK